MSQCQNYHLAVTQEVSYTLKMLEFVPNEPIAQESNSEIILKRTKYTKVTPLTYVSMRLHRAQNYLVNCILVENIIYTRLTAC